MFFVKVKRASKTVSEDENVGEINAAIKKATAKSLKTLDKIFAN